MQHNLCGWRRGGREVTAAHPTPRLPALSPACPGSRRSSHPGVLDFSSPAPSWTLPRYRGASSTFPRGGCKNSPRHKESFCLQMNAQEIKASLGSVTFLLTLECGSCSSGLLPPAGHVPGELRCFGCWAWLLRGAGAVENVGNAPSCRGWFYRTSQGSPSTAPVTNG